MATRPRSPHLQGRTPPARSNGPTAWRARAALSSAARPQSGRLVSLGTGSLRTSPPRRQTDLSLDRLQHLLLVSRDGAEGLLQREDRRVHERALRLRQSGPRRTSRRRRTVHAGPAGLLSGRRQQAGEAAGRCRCSSLRPANRLPAEPTFLPKICPAGPGSPRSWNGSTICG